MPHSVVAVLLFTSLVSSTLGADPITGTMIRLPAPGGWVVLPDGATLVVSQPDKGQLVFFDTIAEKETHRWELDFKPTRLAFQGNTLFVAVKGASTVHALDAKTGRQLREISLGGDAVSNMACHPSKGLLYASTETLQVFSIDPRDGTATRTNATGNFLAVDPTSADAVFTGTSPPREEEEIIIKGLPGNRIKVYWDQWGTRAFILKYGVDGKNLNLMSSQKNAAVNAYSLNITPDGKKVMMTSGGGWRPPVEGGTGGGYMSAAFSAENLSSRVGEAPSGTNMAFHPVLNLGVLNHAGRDIEFFNPKSLVAGQKFSLAPGADGRPLLITFGGKGTKVILWNGDNTANPLEGLHFLTIELTAEDRTALQKVYGKLPTIGKAPQNLTKSTTSPSGPVPKRTSPMPKVDRPTASIAPKTITPEVDDAVPLAANVIAATGFNDAKGLNSNSMPNAPYQLDKNNVPGGLNEYGWLGVWQPNPLATYLKDNTAEGDGIVHLLPTINFGRSWKTPQKEKFLVETMVRCPGKEGMQCYVWQTDHNTTGPMWGVLDGKFSALNGDGQGGGPRVNVADCKPDTWYKVRLTIDPAKRRWSMAVDDVQHDAQFGFRHKPALLQGINFLVEGKQEIYLDAIRILSTP